MSVNFNCVKVPLWSEVELAQTVARIMKYCECTLMWFFCEILFSLSICVLPSKNTMDLYRSTGDGSGNQALEDSNWDVKGVKAQRVLYAWVD